MELEPQPQPQPAPSAEEAVPPAALEDREAAEATAMAEDALEPLLGLGQIEEVEVLVCICSYLAPKELGRLACVSASFGRKTAWQRSPPAAGESTEQRSVVEETAQRWVASRPANEQAWSAAMWPGCDWLRCMHKMIQVPHPAVLLVTGAGSPECNGYYEKCADIPATGTPADSHARRNLAFKTVYCKVDSAHPDAIVPDIRWNASRSAWMLCTTKGARSINRYINRGALGFMDPSGWQVFNAYDAALPGIAPAPSTVWLASDMSAIAPLMGTCDGHVQDLPAAYRR
jgi:hypothetical protein